MIKAIKTADINAMSKLPMLGDWVLRHRHQVLLGRPQLGFHG